MVNELMIHSIPDVERMAIAIAKSGLFGAKSPEQAFALMLIAQAEGRHPAEAGHPGTVRATPLRVPASPEPTRTRTARG